MKWMLVLFLFISMAGGGVYYVYEKFQEEQMLQTQHTQELMELQKKVVEEQRKVAEEQKRVLKQVPQSKPLERVQALPRPQPAQPLQQHIGTEYHCDGRVYCSQMNSLDEARWFIKNCPGTKMDGDRNGEPCERDSRFH